MNAGSQGENVGSQGGNTGLRLRIQEYGVGIRRVRLEMRGINRNRKNKNESL